MAGETTYDERKLEELIVYVASRLADEEAGGATKLNKVLYYAEAEFMRMSGRTITGAEYQKLDYGPAPRRLKPVRKELLARGDVRIEQEHYFGRVQDRLVSSRPADTSVFDPDELATIDKVLDELRDLNSTQVSERSHREPGWLVTGMYDTIDPLLAYLRPTVLLPRMKSRAKQIAAERGLH